MFLLYSFFNLNTWPEAKWNNFPHFLWDLGNVETCSSSTASSPLHSGVKLLHIWGKCKRQGIGMLCQRHSIASAVIPYSLPRLPRSIVVCTSDIRLKEKENSQDCLWLKCCEIFFLRKINRKELFEFSRFGNEFGSLNVEFVIFSVFENNSWNRSR